MRDGDPPVEVAGHRPRADLLEQPLGEVEDRRPPGAGRLALVEPLADGAGEGGQVEEEVLRLDELRHLAVDPRVRLDEVGGVELVAAVVALVAPGLAVAADRAGSLDVAVRQGAAGRRADRAARRLLDHVAVAPVAGEQLLRDGVVVERRRAGEEVVGQAEVREVLGDDAVVAVGQLARADALPVGLDEDRRPVLVGPADHEHVVAGHPHVPAEHVGRHAEPGHVADVARPVGVRPGDGGQDMTHAAQPRPQPPPTFRPGFPASNPRLCQVFGAGSARNSQQLRVGSGKASGEELADQVGVDLVGQGQGAPDRDVVCGVALLPRRGRGGEVGQADPALEPRGPDVPADDPACAGPCRGAAGTTRTAPRGARA